MLSKIFNKGQIVIPARLRRKYDLEIGSKINIIDEEDGIKIVPAEEEINVEALAGIFKDYAKDREVQSKDEITKITGDYFVESTKDEIY